MTFRNMKIGKKLCIAFFLVIFVSAISSSFALHSLDTVKNLNNKLFDGPYVATSETTGLCRDVIKIDQKLSNAVLAEKGTEIYYSKKEIYDTFKDMEKRILNIEKTFDDKDDVDELKNQITTFESESRNLIELLSAGEIAKAKNQVLNNNSSYSKTYNKIQEFSTNVSDEAKKDALAFHEESNKKITTAVIMSIVLLIVSLIISIIICIYMTRRLKNPIKELEIAANKMAKGDFDINIEYKSSDELGMLSDSMRLLSSEIKQVIEDSVNSLQKIASGNFDVKLKANYIGIFEEIEKSIQQITKDLSYTLYQINLASVEVKQVSEQVAMGAQNLSQGSSEQACAVQELTATIVDIAQKVKDTAGYANEANTLTLSAVTDIKVGSEQMTSMVESMEVISKTSNEISKIIRTIDDIAFQTNILALNAAVEAARAGDSGRGFAVVAEEVRKLAAKSAEAAKNTSTLIESSIKAVNNGTIIVNNTANSLQKIIKNTNQTHAIIEDIAKKSVEESDEIEQVTQGLSQISDVVQTNSATAEESAAASEELSGQASMLESLIENFTLKKEEIKYRL